MESRGDSRLSGWKRGLKEWAWRRIGDVRRGVLQLAAAAAAVAVASDPQEEEDGSMKMTEDGNEDRVIEEEVPIH